MKPQRLTVAVIRAGRAPKHDVSLASGDSIAGAVRHLGHDVVDVLIDRDGAWRAVDTMGLPAVIGCSRGSMSPSRPCTAVGVRTGTVQGLSTASMSPT